MTIPNTDKDMFAQYIQQAAVSLKDKNCDSAYSLILEAMYADPSAPQPHNLLGIFYELLSDENLARRHYRAAYSLDPTYKPACRNLERICTTFDDRPRTFDYGDIAGETASNSDSKQLKSKRT